MQAWDERTQLLYFVDIENCKVVTCAARKRPIRNILTLHLRLQVHVYNPKDGSDKVLTLPEHCSSVLLTTDPSSLVITTVKCVLGSAHKALLWACKL